MTATPAHDWMLPQLMDLLARAAAAGISEEVAVAVLSDLIAGPAFNTAPLPDE